MRVLTCLTEDHDLSLVVLAALICALGAAFLVRLSQRARTTEGALRGIWTLLGAIVGGSTVWVTHFVAMLAYRNTLTVTYDPFWTLLSLVGAVAGCGAAITLYARRWRYAPEAAGVVFGATVAGMHYLGMAGFNTQGVLIWDQGGIAASIAVALLLGALAFNRGARPLTRYCHVGSGVGVFLTIVGLHFTGMAALTIVPLSAAPLDVDSAGILAVAASGIGLLAVGAGSASYLLDRHLSAQRTQELARLAKHDALTELPNRAAFLDRLDRSLEFAGSGRSLAVVVLDLERFKDVNEAHGHAAGDGALRAIAARLRGALRDGEFVARLGGDEFGALALVDGRPGAGAFAERLEAAVAAPLRVGEGDVSLQAAIGVACYPEDAAGAAALLANADLAMQRAKGGVSGGVCFYEATTDEAARARRALVRELRDAIDAGQFELRYQAQTSLATGETTGFEALIRWRHPVRGYVSPAEFISLAEETGLIVPIGEWVLRHACATAATWPTPWKVAVNLSAVQLGHVPDLPRLVHEILLETGLSPRRLELEITETAMMGDPAHTIHVLRRLGALGVSIAMDDFGTGYSSLSTLRAFPFDKIKLDKSFVDEVMSDPQARAIIGAVVSLGQSLGIGVLAEGVETGDQAAFLQSVGCGAAQGYHFGRPEPVATPAKLEAAWRIAS
ncbi:MAG: EAL domain-containing protein [Alphaproteobacteria bacterium]|nr:EAL domain-containing protein [Alphaproteobacteria bacterium]